MYNYVVILQLSYGFHLTTDAPFIAERLGLWHATIFRAYWVSLQQQSGTSWFLVNDTFEIYLNKTCISQSSWKSRRFENRRVPDCRAGPFIESRFAFGEKCIEIRHFNHIKKVIQVRRVVVLIDKCYLQVCSWKNQQ